MFSKETQIVFYPFLVLALLTLVRVGVRMRTRRDWIVDGLGLFTQGVLIPWAQTAVIADIFVLLFPSLHGSVSMPNWVSALCGFAGLDFFYYWNHRLLHSQLLWPVHAFHHSSRFMDVFSTSRNTLWAPLLIVYLWAAGVAVAVLESPLPFLMGMALGSALDLWRHSRLGFVPGSRVHRAFRWVLITPHEHEWHHSEYRHGVNFGANLALWDRVFGTYHSPEEKPAQLGVMLEQRSFWSAVLKPYRMES